MADNKRILLHYTHKQTLGHTTRVISLASTLISSYHKRASLCILQGGIRQPMVSYPSGCEVLDIPFPFDSRSSFNAKTTSDRPSDRAAFMLKAVDRFKPDIFITEFFPFGRSDYMPELLPVLQRLKKTNCQIIASIGYPSITSLSRLEDKKFAALFRVLLSAYDSFLIHTPPDIETPYFHSSIKPQALADLYHTTLNSIKTKTFYTGYILPVPVLTQNTKHPPNCLPPAKYTVVISRGGGAVYPKIIVNAIRAQKILGKDFRTILACGPSTSDQEWVLFKKAHKEYGGKQTALFTHLPDLDNRLSTCQVSVSLSGYNTSVQLMHHATPAVIVPYQNKLSRMPMNDQIARAQLLEEKFGSIVLPYDTMSPLELANAIRRRSEMPPPPKAPASWFQGAARSAALIMGG